MTNTHTTLTSLFAAIANAIRAKTGGTEVLVADNFPTAIEAIPSGGSETYEITFTKNSVDTTKSYVMVLSRNYGTYGESLTNSGGTLTDTVYLGDRILIEVSGGDSVSVTGLTASSQYTLEDPFTGTVDVYSYIVAEGTTHSVTVG